MSRRADENGQLTSLLQALPAPEPSAEFLAGARRRYLEAIEARDGVRSSPASRPRSSAWW